MAAPLKRLFNMVEVTLAIAVVGIGVSGIMALFPVAINSSRDAVGDNFASFAADKFIHFFSGMATAGADQASLDTNWNSYIGSLATNLSPETEAHINSAASGPWSAISSMPGLYTTSVSSRIFRVVQGDPSRPDFDGTVNIWFSEALTAVYNGTEWKTWPKDAGLDFKQYLVGINIEISWPNSKPYKNREKRFFYLEAAKPVR